MGFGDRLLSTASTKHDSPGTLQASPPHQATQTVTGDDPIVLQQAAAEPSEFEQPRGHSGYVSDKFSEIYDGMKALVRKAVTPKPKPKRGVQVLPTPAAPAANVLSKASVEGVAPEGASGLDIATQRDQTAAAADAGKASHPPMGAFGGAVEKAFHDAAQFGSGGVAHTMHDDTEAERVRLQQRARMLES